MTTLLEGRVAIVTGGGRSIGRAIATALAAAGARVVVADNGTSNDGVDANPSIGRETAATIGAKAIAFTDSIASPGAARQLVELAVKRFGGLDIVVHGASIRRDAPVFHDDRGDWDAVIRNNLSAAFYLINAAAPVMRRQVDTARGGSGRYDWGRIIILVSPPVPEGAAGQAGYVSANAGLIALTQATAVDLAEDRVTANAVTPFTDTDTKEIANLVVSLCVPSGSAITGKLLNARDGKMNTPS